MKKFISTLVAAMLVAVIGINMASCGKTAEARLMVEVENFNKNYAGKNAGNGITMQKCDLNEESKMLIFNFSFIEPGVTVAELEPVMGEFKSEMIKSIAADKDGQELVNLLTEAGYGMEFVIKGRRTHKDVKATFTAEEVAKIAKK